MKPLSNEPAVRSFGPQLPRNFSIPSGWLKIIALVVIGAALVYTLNRVNRDTLLTLADTRPIVQVAAVLMGAWAAWGVLQVGMTFAREHRRIAWRTSLHLVGWMGVAGSAVGLAIFLFQSSDDKGLPIGGAVQTVGSLIPLVIGIQSAFLLSPEDEPGIEVLLACPRRISWVLLERLAIVWVSQAALALVGLVISMSITGEGDAVVEAARWIPASVMFSGVAIYITLASRQPAFSVAVVGILWFAFKFLGGALLPGQPSLWPLNLVQPFAWAIHPYLQPNDLPLADWWLNRAVVMAVGIILTMLAVRQLRDEEQVLLSGAKSIKQSGGDS